MMLNSGSSSGRSITCPLPPFASTSRKAIIAALAPYKPATLSARYIGGSTGSRSPKPFIAAKPDMPSISVPKPGRRR